VTVTIMLMLLHSAVMPQWPK